MNILGLILLYWNTSSRSCLYLVPCIKCFLEFFAKSLAKTFNYRVVSLGDVIEFLLSSCLFVSNVTSNYSWVLEWTTNWRV